MAAGGCLCRPRTVDGGGGAKTVLRLSECGRMRTHAPRRVHKRKSSRECTKMYTYCISGGGGCGFRSLQAHSNYICIRNMQTCILIDQKIRAGNNAVIAGTRGRWRLWPHATISQLILGRYPRCSCESHCLIFISANGSFDIAASHEIENEMKI